MKKINWMFWIGLIFIVFAIGYCSLNSLDADNVIVKEVCNGETKSETKIDSENCLVRWQPQYCVGTGEILSYNDIQPYRIGTRLFSTSIQDEDLLMQCKNGRNLRLVGTGKGSDSMSPLMWGGNKLIVCELNEGDELKIGDWVLFTVQGINSQILHRIKEINSAGYLMQGTNNCGEEGFVDREDITDIVIGVLYS